MTGFRTTSYVIRAARVDDLPAVQALLGDAELPLDGLEEQFGDSYAVVEADGRVVGAAGIEVHGRHGLLRSAVVDAGWRGRGLGDALTRDRLAWASSRGLGSVYLLTTTAADFFPRFGFTEVERASAPLELQASREFASACPASAITMRRVLSPEDAP